MPFGNGSGNAAVDHGDLPPLRPSAADKPGKRWATAHEEEKKAQMIDGSYGSHAPWLALLCSRTSGPVLELGTGINSTPLLHVMVAMQRRLLISYETEQWWADQFKELAGDFHQIVDVADWSKVNFPRAEIAFVDCHPAREERKDVCPRVTLIKRLKLSSTFIVAHDTEADIPPSAGAYGWCKLDGLFKYQTVLDKFRPWTTVYSDVEEFRP